MYTYETCPGPKCPECKKLLSSVTTRATNEGCEECRCEWWPGGHHEIIEKSLEKWLTKEQLSLLKSGGDIIDDNHQATNDAHMHAMRRPNQSTAEALAMMKAFFVENVKDFYKTGNYASLGMALHPIMDAYSPPHRFKEWEDDLEHLYLHGAEALWLHPEDALLAKQALPDVYLHIIVKDPPEHIFNEWAKEFSQFYQGVL